MDMDRTSLYCLNDLPNLTSEEAIAEVDNWLSRSVNNGVDIFNQSESFEDFTSWISAKAGLKQKNEEIKSATCIIATFAILETAHHVFSISSGFTKADLTGLNIARILEIVKRIDTKVDKIIKEPMNAGIRHFNSALNEILSKNYEEAFHTLDHVITNATKAFGYASGSDIDMANYKECIKATQLLIFSRISRYSYDKENKCFLPFSTLPLNKVTAIGGSLESLIKEALVQRKNVKTSGIFVLAAKEAKKKSEVQNILDQVLKICYPYTSQANNWTNMKTKIDPNENKFLISVLPAYLPQGIEDATKVVIGVKIGDDHPSSVLLWRTTNHVYCMYGTFATMEEFSSETVLVQIDIMNDNCPRVVVSSHGYVARYHGASLGHYILCDQDRNIYLQFSSELANQLLTGIYYSNGDLCWKIGSLIQPQKCWLKNESCSKSVPEIGWKFLDESGLMSMDRTLVVARGPLSLCGTITISGDIADRMPQYSGVFHVMDKMMYGKSVFINDNGKILYSSIDVDGNNKWLIQEIDHSFDNLMLQGNKFCLFCFDKKTQRVLANQ